MTETQARQESASRATIIASGGGRAVVSAPIISYGAGTARMSADDALGYARRFVPGVREVSSGPAADGLRYQWAFSNSKHTFDPIRG